MRKILGITMGDPAGVGPEITVKALQDPKVYESCKPLVVGDAAILERACGFVGAKCTIHPVADPSEGLYEHGIIDILDLGLLKPEDFAIGQVSAAAGDAAFRYVRKVIELAMDGKVDATVTNPLNKEAMNLAGHHFSGHTEIYAYYTGTEHYTMMLAHKDLRVVHVSTHVSLREACDRVKKDRVLEVIRIAENTSRVPIPRSKLRTPSSNYWTHGRKSASATRAVERTSSLFVRYFHAKRRTPCILTHSNIPPKM